MYLRTDNKEAAKTGVKKLCEAIGDSGEIALLLNDSVSENGKEREAGVKEEIKANHPDVSVVETIYVDELDQLKRKAAAEQLGMSAEDLAAAEAGEKMDDAAQTTGTANGSGTDTAETSANGDDGTAAGGTDTATKDGATAPTVAEKFEEVKSAADKMSNEEAVAYYLKKHPELKGIFALNETSTQLGIQVLDELDNSDEIQIVGFDAGKEEFYYNIASSYVLGSILTFLMAGCGIAALVLMILVRVKYPQSVFGKVLMWLYIALAILVVVCFSTYCTESILLRSLYLYRGCMTCKTSCHDHHKQQDTPQSEFFAFTLHTYLPF